jgi:hypothetical protein
MGKKDNFVPCILERYSKHPLERQGLLFETALLWKLENKEQMQLRELGTPSHNVLMGEDHKREGKSHRSAEKFKQWGTRGMKIVVVSGPAFLGKEKVPSLENHCRNSTKWSTQPLGPACCL